MRSTRTAASVFRRDRSDGNRLANIIDTPRPFRIAGPDRLNSRQRREQPRPPLAGNSLVIAAPSGAGKTTLVRALMEQEAVAEVLDLG